eukprot:365110-Chlamydomonas_euryale.AAC.1
MSRHHAGRHGASDGSAAAAALCARAGGRAASLGGCDWQVVAVAVLLKKGAEETRRDMKNIVVANQGFRYVQNRASDTSKAELPGPNVQHAAPNLGSRHPPARLLTCNHLTVCSPAKLSICLPICPPARPPALLSDLHDRRRAHNIPPGLLQWMGQSPGAVQPRRPRSPPSPLRPLTLSYWSFQLRDGRRQVDMHDPTNDSGAHRHLHTYFVHLVAVR